MYKYIEVIDLSDPEVVVCFQELLKEDPDVAIKYLSQWDYGEQSSENILTRSQIFDGLSFTKYVEDESYLALWQIGIGGIILYRKIACEII